MRRKLLQSVILGLVPRIHANSKRRFQINRSIGQPSIAAGRGQRGKPGIRDVFYVMTALILAATAAIPAGADDIAAGRKKVATVCAACHGVDGIAKNPDAPNLAGDSPGYIIKQLRAFKSGARQQDQMSIIAKDLSDDDMANVAAWYSGLKVTVTMPQ